MDQSGSNKFEFKNFCPEIFKTEAISRLRRVDHFRASFIASEIIPLLHSRMVTFLRGLK
jgi:hypothetical protein